jgi:hypothetical protein
MSPQLLFSLIVRFPDISIVDKLINKKVTIPENVLEKSNNNDQSSGTDLVISQNSQNNISLQSTMLHELKLYVFYQNQFMSYFESKNDEELMKDFPDELNMGICMNKFLESHIQLKDILLTKEEGTANIIKNGIKINNKQSKLTHFYNIFAQSRKNYEQVKTRLNKLQRKLLKTNKEPMEQNYLTQSKQYSLQKSKH